MSNELAVLENQFKPLLPKFEQALDVPGVNMPAAHLVRSILVSCERNPKLLACTRQSIFNAAMSAACLGLECDGVTGQAFLIPFELKGTPTAQLVIGYKGYSTLAARSGITITGEVVREGDKFDFDLGEGWLKHKPLITPQERRIIAVWAKAAAKDRPPVIKVLPIDDILAVKAKSPGARKADSPWNDPRIGFPAMAEKTAKRRLARSLPLNVMQVAARMEEAFEEQGLPAQIVPDKGVVVEEIEADEQPAAAELTAPVTPELELGPAPKQPTTTDQLAAYDRRLIEAADQGMTALENTWIEIPYEYRVTLKSALERRHKPKARQVDDAGK